jgi:hypothetical protein
LTSLFNFTSSFSCQETALFIDSKASNVMATSLKAASLAFLDENWFEIGREASELRSKSLLNNEKRVSYKPLYKKYPQIELHYGSDSAGKKAAGGMVTRFRDRYDGGETTRRSNVFHEPQYG